MYNVIEVLDEGCVDHPKQYEYKSSNSIAAFNQYIWEHKDFPPFEPDLTLQIAREKNHSTLNDFLFYSAQGFIISPKVKDIFEHFSLPRHRFYPTKVVKNNKEYLYYYFYFFSDTVSSVDFEKSKLYFVNDLNEKIDFSVASLEEFRQLKQTEVLDQELEKGLLDSNGLPRLGTVKQALKLRRRLIKYFRAHEIVFGSKFDREQDMFQLPEFSWMCYISTRLKDELERVKVTGVVFSIVAARQYLADRPNPLIKWID